MNRRLLRIQYMRDRNLMDNRFKEGTIITAKENPDLKLIITKYCQRIYHCRAVGEPGGKAFAYFERNLIAVPDTNVDRPLRLQ